MESQYEVFENNLANVGLTVRQFLDMLKKSDVTEETLRKEVPGEMFALAAIVSAISNTIGEGLAKNLLADALDLKENLQK